MNNTNDYSGYNGSCWDWWWWASSASIFSLINNTDSSSDRTQMAFVIKRRNLNRFSNGRSIDHPMSINWFARKITNATATVATILGALSPSHLDLMGKITNSNQIKSVAMQLIWSWNQATKLTCMITDRVNDRKHSWVIVSIRSTFFRRKCKFQVKVKVKSGSEW